MGLMSPHALLLGATSSSIAGFEPLVLGLIGLLLLVMLLAKILQGRSAKRRRAASTVYYDRDVARYGRGTDERTSTRASADRAGLNGPIPYGSTEWHALREPAPIDPLPMPVLANVIDQNAKQGMPVFDAAGAYALRISQQQIEADLQEAKLQQVAPRQGPMRIPTLTQTPADAPLPPPPTALPPPPPGAVDPGQEIPFRAAPQGSPPPVPTVPVTQAPPDILARDPLDLPPPPVPVLDEPVVLVALPPEG